MALTLRRHEGFNHLFCDMARPKSPVLVRGLHNREVEELALLFIFCQVVVEYNVKLHQIR